MGQRTTEHATKDYRARSGFEIWARVRDLVCCYGLDHRIWVQVKGHSTGSGYKLRVIAQDLVTS